MWPLLCSEIISLSLIFLIQLSRGDKSSCIPEEYRGVRRDVWKGLNGGWYLKHLTQDKRFPDSPTLIEVLRTFTPPRNDDNYYGQQLRAFFIPPSNGNYTFHATCDSECVFYLSPDERPGNKKEVLRIDQSHRTSYNQWNKYLQQSSCVQQLERRKLYYIEALHSNYVDNDHVRIHIKYPGSSTVTPLGVEHLFLYSPGSSPQATCVLLRRCNITCSGGLGTRIRARNKLHNGACVKQTKDIYKEPPSLHVEAHNVTHSTAVIAWTPLLRNESGVILVSGYRVSLRSQDDRIHVKQVNISISSLLFEDLKTFTNYCVTVEPLTALAGTENEDCYHLMTDENTPSLPPLNITAKYKEPLSMIVEWKPLPREHRNGIIRGYRLTLKSISAIDQHEKPTELETKKWRREVTVLGPSVLWIEFSDVRAFTWYCVRMLAFTTKGDGDESTCVFLLTGESVPSSAPLNVTTTPLNSTSFLVAWQPVPLKNANGIVLGYRVLLENMADGSLLLDKTLHVNQTRVTLNRPKKVSRFCARVMAFTHKGEGKSSSCTEAWSWSKETVFPDMTAQGHSSPTGIKITWDAPRDQVIHKLSHYHVTYETISEAGRPVLNASKFSVNVSANSRELPLDDLETYTGYKITVESVSSDGKVQNSKVFFAETCRCPNQLQANWIPSPPYVIRNTSTSKPGGILPELLSRMLQDSCGACLSHKTGNISYAINTTVSVTQPDNQLLLDFDFPVRSAVGRTIYKGIHAYVPLVTVPGVALMTRKKTPSAYARELEHSVFACWPIFAMSFALAILTGIIIWFVESETNYKQFYHFFHKGLPEGVWWSLITMTTVGYGDKYPKTIMGRFIAIVWFLTGIVLSSLLISSLTSSMSVRILDQRLDVTRGKKVGSLPQFPEYDILLRHISTAGGSKTYSSLEQLVDALGNNEVDGILVDLYTAHYRSDLFNASWMIVSKIIPYEFTTGVVITGNAAKLAQHFRDFIGNKSTVVTDILQKTTQENNEENTPRRREAKQIPLLDPKTEEYRMAITILFSALCFAVIVGLLYHLWYKKLQEQRYDLQDIRREERNHHMKAIQELRQIVVEFYQRFSLTYKQLRLKHCKELEQLKLIHDTECLIAVENTRGKISDHLLNGTWV